MHFFHSLQISKLDAAVCKIEPCSTTVTVRETDCEVRTCYIADETATIELSLWEKHIELVQPNQSYSFTNLTTRTYRDITTLTTTRQTTITPLHKPISYTPLDPTTTGQTPLRSLTAELEGAIIHLMKLCPKCHTPQKDLTLKEQFHRCHSCKILRKCTSYLTKCNGTLTFRVNDEEIALSITNSALTKFIKQHQDITNMDAQSIEEFLITTGPVTIHYTEENQITILNKASSTQAQDSTEHHNSDEELCQATLESTPLGPTDIEHSTQQTIKHQTQDSLTNKDCPLPQKLPKPSEMTQTPSTTQTTDTEDATKAEYLPVPALISDKDKPKKTNKKH
ncbi:MAG: hypothetical protein ACRCZW_09555 [Lactobacillaceae bacterium]